MIDPPTEPLQTFQNATSERKKTSESKNNDNNDVISADGSAKELVAAASDVDVVGESSKSFRGEKGDFVVEAMKERASRVDFREGKGKGKGKEREKEKETSTHE